MSEGRAAASAGAQYEGSTLASCVCVRGGSIALSGKRAEERGLGARTSMQVLKPSPLDVLKQACPFRVCHGLV